MNKMYFILICAWIFLIIVIVNAVKDNARLRELNNMVTTAERDLRQLEEDKQDKDIKELQEQSEITRTQVNQLVYCLKNAPYLNGNGILSPENNLGVDNYLEINGEVIRGQEEAFEERSLNEN